MSRKGRSRRLKMPMSVRGGEGSSSQLRGDRGSTPRLEPEMVETTSSPRPTPRPVAPPLFFASRPSQPTKSADAAEAPKSPTPAADEPPALDPAREPMSRDDVSVPPVGLDSAFFDEPLAAESTLEMDHRDERAARKANPIVARRRARLARYVTVAVGLASALCAAAVIKSTAARGHEEHLNLATAREAPAAAEPALNAPTTTEQGTSTVSAPNSIATDKPTAELPAADPTQGGAGMGTGATAQAEPVDTAQGAPAAAASAVGDPAVAPAASSGAAPASETSQAAVDEPPSDPKEAAKEAAKAKVKARGALEWGKLTDAIAAGEQSVALDATDAEAWLILGAAYQQKGDSKNAFRSFRSCIDQGKRGPRSECAAMLR